jgi:RHS repeat-associated protein
MTADVDSLANCTNPTVSDSVRVMPGREQPIKPASALVDIQNATGSRAKYRVRLIRKIALVGLACAATSGAAYALICEPFPYCNGGGQPIVDSNAGAPSDGGATDDSDGSQGCDVTSCTDAPQQDTPANDSPPQPANDALNDDIAQQDELTESLLKQDEELAAVDSSDLAVQADDQGCATDPYYGDPICPDTQNSGNADDGENLNHGGDYGNTSNSGDFNTYTDSDDTGDPINAATGNKFAIQRDYTGRGPFPLRFRRFYNSLSLVSAAAVTELGAHWRSTFDSAVQVVSGQSAPTMRVVRPDGKSFLFTQSGTQWVASDPGVTAVLQAQMNSSGAITGWTYTTHGDMTETYNGTGQLVSIAARTGLTETLAYNTAGELATVTDPFGRTLSFTYDASGRITQMTNPAGGVFSYAYDSNNNLAAVTYPDKAVRSYAYENPAFPNALTGIIDENGSRFATWTYDGQGRVVAQVLGAGAQSITLSYNSDGTTTVTDALGASRVHGFVTNAQGTIRGSTKVSTCSGCATLTGSATYDANGFRASLVDANGNTTLLAHNALGELTSRTAAVGTPQARTFSVNWHPTFHRPTQISFPGKTLSYAYDSQGNRLQRTEIAGGITRTWSYQYNALGLLTQITGPRTDVAEVTHLTYDAQGDLASITNALGQTKQCTARDPNGRCLTTVDRNGIVTQLTYDPRGRLLTRTKANQTTRYQYAATGQLSQLTLPNGSTLQFGYDAAHRLTDLTDALGNHTHYTLDGAGNRTQVQLFSPTGSLVRSVSHAYDPLGRLISTTDANQDTTAFSNDNNSNVVAVTDALGRTTSIGYDALNRPVSTTDPLGNVTSVQLDSYNRPLTVTAPNGALTQYSFDGFGDLLQEVSPDRGTSVVTYTSAGIPSTRTDARGVTASFSFDALTRLTQVSYTQAPSPGGLLALWIQALGSSILSDNVTLTYDQGTGCALGVGRLCARQDQSGIERYSYDPYGNVTQQAHTILGYTYTTSYQYDPGNLLTQMTYPDGRTVTYSRDALERLTGVQATLNRVASVAVASAFQYNADNTLASITFGNGLTETRAYDPVGRLVSQLVGNADARSYAYNAVGDMTAKQTSAESDQFTYDALDRLTGEGRTQGTTTQSNGFGYDGNGNRLSEVRNGVTTNLTYAPASNRLIQLGSSTITLDPSGNTTADNGGSRTFYYSAANHLQIVSQNGLPIAGYLYNGSGQRVGKLTLQGVSLYHYDIFGRLISETTIGSQPSRDYVWADSTPIAQVDHWVPIGTMVQEAHCTIGPDGKIDWISYLDTDGIGTPRVATDVSQNIVWRDDGEAFGETLPTQSVPSGVYPVTINLRNPGQYFDQETGFFYNVARFYNPQSGRYIASDPLGLTAGLNTYTYVASNPLSNSDPMGLIGPQETSIQNEIEVAIATRNVSQLTNLIESGALSPTEQALAEAGLNQVQILNNSTASVSRLAQLFNRTSNQIRTAIEQCKQAGLPRSGPVRNPDVVVDMTTGEVYPTTSSGGIGDSIGNISDYLPAQ